MIARATLIAALVMIAVAAEAQVLILQGGVINQGQVEPLIPIGGGKVLGATDVYKAFMTLTFTDDAVMAFDISQHVAYNYGDRVSIAPSELGVQYGSDLQVWNAAFGGFDAYDGTDLSYLIANGAMVLLNSNFGESKALSTGLAAYVTGDVFPFAAASSGNATGNVSGNFGDGAIDTLDLLAVLRAVTKIPGYVPDACSDRFDAMDVFPGDTSGRGGDGAVDTLDLLALLRRVTKVDTSPAAMRLPRTSCAAPQTTGPQAARIVFRRVADGRVQIVLHADRGVHLAGLALGLEGTGFAAATGRQPSMLDTQLPGIVAAAWLEEISLKGGESIVLGELRQGGAPKLHALSLAELRESRP